jgi:hypothetical protein
MIPKSGYRFSEKDHAPTVLKGSMIPKVVTGFRKKIMLQLF